MSPKNLAKAQRRTQLVRLRLSLESLEKSNLELKNAVTGYHRRLSEFQKVLQIKTERNDTIYLYAAALVFAAVSAVAVFFLIYRKKFLFSERAEIAKSDSEQHDTSPENHAPSMNFQARTPNCQGDTPQENHALPLRLGLEIHRMRKRMANIPADTKGLGALENSLRRLEESFNDRGYEIVDLLGKPFTEGMTVHARFAPSDVPDSGEQLITKIIQPQINFEGVLIQPGEVEVRG